MSNNFRQNKGKTERLSWSELRLKELASAAADREFYSNDHWRKEFQDAGQ